MKILLIACPNGFGHTSRLEKLGSLLDKMNHSVSFLIGEAQKNFLHTIVKEWQNTPWIVTGRALSLLNEGGDPRKSIAEYLSTIKNYNDFDLVICDNFPEIIEFRSDAILMSNFLWCEVLNNHSYSCDSKALLSKFPVSRVISNRFFATPALQEHGFYPINFLGRFNPSLTSIPGDKLKILVSCGNSDEAHRYYTQLADSIINNPLFLKYDIYVEAFFLEHTSAKNVKRAMFNDLMFNEISMAIIRPGMGTLAECITRAIPIIAYEFGDNFEMRHNAEVVNNRYGCSLFDLNTLPNKLDHVKNFIYEPEGIMSEKDVNDLLNRIT